MFASDVAAELDVSKHEVLVAMLRDGADIARDRYAKDDMNVTTDSFVGDGHVSNHFMLNTNKSQHEETHDWMLRDKTAAAFCSPWKYKIERIKAGDTVFHYESGTGIVGFGVANGKLQKTEFFGQAEDTYYYKLDNYQKVDKEAPAKKVKEILGRKIPFASTLIALRGGEVLENALKKMI
ncbi:hypothetical protein [Cedecea colo]|uniref:Uncharacterized protein n=1 Tax=Cedecea colo TaxID=2552946 RepID=A0ABX0VIL4_9ENTR|nr:hypothetical protein [Cedecea colo]NIY46440.1 hypothetical protein [Cedecea colo]